MTVAEMQTTIRRIVDAEYGLSAFAVLINDGALSLRKFLLDDSLGDRTKTLLEDILRSRYMNESIELDSVENIDDNRKVYYEIVQDDEYYPFAFLDTYQTVTESYGEQAIDQLTGLAFRLNINETAIWLYQQISYPQIIKRSKNLYAILQRNAIYTPLEKDVLKIEKKIDCLIIGPSIITSNIELMQRQFHFESYTRREAKQTIDLISELEIVDNIDRFIALGEQKALTHAKKLMKAKHSPVLRMEKSVLLRKLATLPRYKDKLEIKDGRIRISNQKQALEFLKMLNDSILRSELTDAEYDSSVKTELPPLPENT